jgi:hypothetical protein
MVRGRGLRQASQHSRRRPVPRDGEPPDTAGVRYCPNKRWCRSSPPPRHIAPRFVHGGLSRLASSVKNRLVEGARPRRSGTYLAAWDNARRRHSTLDHRCPAEYERELLTRGRAA